MTFVFVAYFASHCIMSRLRRNNKSSGIQRFRFQVAFAPELGTPNRRRGASERAAFVVRQSSFGRIQAKRRLTWNRFGSVGFLRDKTRHLRHVFLGRREMLSRLSSSLRPSGRKCRANFFSHVSCIGWLWKTCVPSGAFPLSILINSCLNIHATKILTASSEFSELSTEYTIFEKNVHAVSKNERRLKIFRGLLKCISYCRVLRGL